MLYKPKRALENTLKPTIRLCSYFSVPNVLLESPKCLKPSGILFFRRRQRRFGHGPLVHHRKVDALKCGISKGSVYENTLTANVFSSTLSLKCPSRVIRHIAEYQNFLRPSSDFRSGPRPTRSSAAPQRIGNSSA